MFNKYCLMNEWINEWFNDDKESILSYCWFRKVIWYLAVLNLLYCNVFRDRII